MDIHVGSTMLDMLHDDAEVDSVVDVAADRADVAVDNNSVTDCK